MSQSTSCCSLEGSKLSVARNHTTVNCLSTWRFSLQSGVVVHELTVTTGIDRVTVHELLLARRQQLCFEWHRFQRRSRFFRNEHVFASARANDTLSQHLNKEHARKSFAQENPFHGHSYPQNKNAPSCHCFHIGTPTFSLLECTTCEPKRSTSLHQGDGVLRKLRNRTLSHLLTTMVLQIKRKNDGTRKHSVDGVSTSGLTTASFTVSRSAQKQ